MARKKGDTIMCYGKEQIICNEINMELRD